MTEHDRLARERAQAHPPSMAAEFGEDLGPSLFPDDGPDSEPARNSTAARIAAGVKADERQAARDHQHALDAARDEQAAKEARRRRYRGLSSAEVIGRMVAKRRARSTP
jgi:hypothetical protein